MKHANLAAAASIDSLPETDDEDVIVGVVLLEQDNITMFIYFLN